MSVAITLHILAAVLWVGGMLFAHMALRPAAASILEPPARLTLWVGVFGRFFPWVWASIVVLLASGYWIVLEVLGGMAAARPHVHTMIGLGFLMILLFMHLFFAPYRKLKKAVSEEDWPLGARALTQIRIIVGINMLLGVLVIAVAASGRYW